MLVFHNNVKGFLYKTKNFTNYLVKFSRYNIMKEKRLKSNQHVEQEDNNS